MIDGTINRTYSSLSFWNIMIELLENDKITLIFNFLSKALITQCRKKKNLLTVNNNILNNMMIESSSHFLKKQESWANTKSLLLSSCAWYDSCCCGYVDNNFLCKHQYGRSWSISSNWRPTKFFQYGLLFYGRNNVWVKSIKMLYLHSFFLWNRSAF